MNIFNKILFVIFIILIGVDLFLFSIYIQNNKKTTGQRQSLSNTYLLSEQSKNNSLDDKNISDNNEQLTAVLPSPPSLVITTYPLSKEIKERLKELNITPLYQLKKDDLIGRSLVFQDKNKDKGVKILNIMPIYQSKDFYLSYLNLNEDRPPIQWVRFVIEDSYYKKSQLIEISSKGEKTLEEVTDLKKIIDQNDVVRLSFQKDKNNQELIEGDREEGNIVRIAEKVFIQRF